MKYSRRVEYGIQRRNIYLVPPAEAHRWYFEQFNPAEVWTMFGFSGPGQARVQRAHRLGEAVCGLLKRVEDQKNIGVVVMFAPNYYDFWEFGYAIPDPADRDAFSALNATDAMAHYMFEHLRVDAMGWRTRADNRSADAVVRRLGYKPLEQKVVDGHNYTFYRLDPEGWAARRRKLEEGEKKYPSGLGEVFITLPTPPYTPIRPRTLADHPMDQKSR